MCLPAAVVGVVTAVTSAVSTISSFSAQQAAVSQQNAVAQAQYQQQLAVYRESERAYSRQMELNAVAANRAYASEQEKLKYEYDKAALEAQELLASSMRTAGTLIASGRTGQSIGVLAADADREASRDLATLGLNLAYADSNYMIGVAGINEQWQSANNMAQSNRMLKPTAPVKIAGPSPIGLITGLAGAAMSGVQAFGALAPPSPGAGATPTFPFAGHETHSSVPMMPLPPVP